VGKLLLLPLQHLLNTWLLQAAAVEPQGLVEAAVQVGI
jgi:hypothetical protein